MKKFLVTGGLGYIGSHTVVELLESNYEVVVLDNLSNSNIKIQKQIEKITKKRVKLYRENILEKTNLREIFEKENIDIVIHFAAFKSVSESIEKPLEYYDNNVVGTINLLNVMKEYNVKDIIFSSSATVYGEAKIMPVKEEYEKLPQTNPYGRTKSIMEDILMDIYKSNKEWNIILLRYFNPVGAHKSGLIGEIPVRIPNNLMPYISKVAFGELEYLKVFGNDYNTIDGTGVRDYIHVVDLARGHIKVIEKIEENCGLKVYNLGTGKGYSVLEMINAFEKVVKKKIPYKILDRRKGDIATCYADVTLAKEELKWEAKLGIDEMCKDFWKWQCEGIKILSK